MKTNEHTAEQLQTQAAFAAWQLGEPIQYEIAGRWLDFASQNRPSICQFDWRPAPKPAPPRPWSAPDDVPGPACWLRFNGQGVVYSCAMIVGVDGGGCWTFEQDAKDTYVEWKHVTNYAHSIDRLNWQPCTVTQPAQ